MAGSILKEKQDKMATLSLVGRCNLQPFVVLGNDNNELSVEANSGEESSFMDDKIKEQKFCVQSSNEDIEFEDLISSMRLVSNPGKYSLSETFRIAQQQGDFFNSWCESENPLTKIRFYYRKDELHLIDSKYVSYDYYPNDSIGSSMIINDASDTFFEVWHCNTEDTPEFPLYRFPLSKCINNKFHHLEKLRDDLLIGFEASYIGDGKVIVRVSLDLKTASYALTSFNSKELENNLHSKKQRTKFMAMLLSLMGINIVRNRRFYRSWMLRKGHLAIPLFLILSIFGAMSVFLDKTLFVEQVPLNDIVTIPSEDKKPKKEIDVNYEIIEGSVTGKAKILAKRQKHKESATKKSTKFSTDVKNYKIDSLEKNEEKEKIIDDSDKSIINIFTDCSKKDKKGNCLNINLK